MMAAKVANIQCHLDYAPDECPQCHRRIEPAYVDGAFRGDHYEYGIDLDLAFQCTARDCKRLFLAMYQHQEVYPQSPLFRLRRTAPLMPRVVEIPSEVEEISPAFAEIYRQALAAEVYGLSQVVGVALRKALEFLVKDFCMARAETADQKEAIKKKFLGPCIEEDVDDPKIQACARLATWLGNDETHYVRRWIDKDLSDLKVLIRLTVGWIESTVLSQRYTEEMKRGSKP